MVRSESDQVKAEVSRANNHDQVYTLDTFARQSALSVPKDLQCFLARHRLGVRPFLDFGVLVTEA